MKEFTNQNYQKEIRQKIPGYDLMLEMIFQALLPVLAPQIQVREILALASQADELRGLAKAFPTAGLTVVEPSQTMLDTLRSQLDLPQTVYLNHFFEEVELEQTYQVCSCLLVLQFVEDPKFFLEKIYQSLEAGGILILSLFSNCHLDYWQSYAAYLGANSQQIQQMAENQASLMRPLSPQELENMLDQVGFAKIERVCQIVSTFVWILRK